MTRAQTTARRVRWTLLVLAMLCWLCGLFWLVNILWPQWQIFSSDNAPEGAGLWGVMGWWFEREWAYGLVVAGYCGLFLLTQWFFLGPRRWWWMRLTDTARPMKRSVIIAALMAALLSTGLLAALLEVPGLWVRFAYRTLPSGGIVTEDPRYWPPLLALAIAWGSWALVFALYWREGDRYTQLGRMVRALIAGSIVELIITVPIHVRAIRSPNCYCAVGSYTGLVFGGTVLLWAFGPGLVLLFLREKYRREQLLGGQCGHCGYDLRGTIAAGRSECPECGAKFASTVSESNS